MSNFNYKSGIFSAGQYQMSAIPYATASVTVVALGSDPVRIDFPRISKFVTIRNVLSPDDTDVPIRVGFSSAGTSGSVAGQDNFFTLSNGESYTGEWRVKSVYLLSDSATEASASIIAGLTGVSTGSVEFDNWSGSLGVG